MSKRTIVGWLFFCVFLFRRFSDCQQKFSVHFVFECLQVVKTTICVFRGKFWRFSIFIFLKVISLAFWKVSNFERYSSRNCILRIPTTIRLLFLGTSHFFWKFQNSTRTKSDFWPKISQVFKTANCVFRGSFDDIKVFVLIGFFSFQKVWEFEPIFLAFPDKKTKDGC